MIVLEWLLLGLFMFIVYLIAAVVVFYELFFGGENEDND